MVDRPSEPQKTGAPISMAKKKTASKKKAASKKKTAAQVPQSTRESVPADTLPRRSLEQALRIPETLHSVFAGKTATWDQLADAIGVGAKSPNTKYLIWSAEAYGLVTRAGSDVTLAETGRKIVAPTYNGEDTEAKVKAIMTPTVLSKFFADYNKHPIPSEQHLPNVLEAKFEVPRERIGEAIKILMDNARYCGIIDEERDPPHINLDRAGVVPEPPPSPEEEVSAPREEEEGASAAAPLTAAEWDRVCFFITPIGDEGTEIRKHADMVLRHLIEPACTECGLTVIRADKIERSGLITQQVLEHLVRARLCIADLSFGNPNAFYELGVRHTTKRPAIQIIRKGDKLPFDVSQGRTIQIDTSDVYTVMDKIESAQRELVQYIQNVMDAGTERPGEDNPIQAYLPKLKVELRE